MRRYPTDDVAGPVIDRRTAMKLAAAAGVSSLSALAGCTNTADTEGKLTAGIAFEDFVNLDPHLMEETVDFEVSQNVFSSLLRFNEDAEIVGDLAVDWTIPDNTTYEFELTEEQVTFHNGDVLDADAAKFSIERLMEMEQSPHRNKARLIESVEAPDDHFLRVNLSQPHAPFLFYFTPFEGVGVIVNQTAIEEDPEAYNRNPVGSGPYEFAEWEPGQYIRLTRFEDYWETDEDGTSQPYIDEVEINLIPETTTLWNSLQTGEIDWAMRLDDSNVEAARGSDSIRVRSVPPESHMLLHSLCNDPAEVWDEVDFELFGLEEPPDYWADRDLPTADPRVRRAVAYAIDSESIVENVYFGNAQPSHTMLTPNMEYFDPPGETDNAHVHDPERARSLLDEAGYTGDPRFSASLLTAEPVYDGEVLASVVQENLRNVGIDVSIDVRTFTGFQEQVFTFQHEFHIIQHRYNFDPYLAWHQKLATLSRETGNGQYNTEVYTNPEFDELMAESVQIMDFDERYPLVKELEQIALTDAPVRALAYTQFAGAHRTDVSGISYPNSSGRYHTASLE